MKAYLLAFLMALAMAPAQAQSAECEAQHFFEKNPGCGAGVRGFKCIELDVRHSVDENGKEFIYAWNFGDGAIQNGYLTEYCYKNYGTYTISLDLLDPKTKLVVRNELTKTVTLLPPIEYQIDSVQQLNVNFQYDSALLPSIHVKNVYWNFDAHYACGKSTSHTFADRGFHLVAIGVTGTQEGNAVSGCTLMGVFIRKEK